MHEAAYVISKLLIAEAITGDKDIESWNNVIDSYVLNLLKLRRMELLSIPTRLAIAISIIGSQRSDLFTTAFRLLCDWQHIGGPFWLVQEEILRFSAIHLFKCEMNSHNADKSVTTSNIRKLLPDVLPNDLPQYITHKILKKRMHFLRTEFEWLLDDIRRGARDEAEATFRDYTDRFPINTFIEWFLVWAQSLLRKFEEFSLHSTSSTRANFQSICRINMCSTPLTAKQTIGSSLPEVPRKFIIPIIARTVVTENTDKNDKRNNQRKEILLKEDSTEGIGELSESDRSPSWNITRMSLVHNTFLQEDEMNFRVPPTAEDGVSATPNLYRKSQPTIRQRNNNNDKNYNNDINNHKKRKHVVGSDQSEKSSKMQFLNNDVDLQVSIPQTNLPECDGFLSTAHKPKKNPNHVVVTAEKKYPSRDKVVIAYKPEDPFGLEELENRTEGESDVREDILSTHASDDVREYNGDMNGVQVDNNITIHDEDGITQSYRIHTGGEAPNDDLGSHFGAMGIDLEEEPKKYISPITPPSGTGISQDNNSNPTAPQIEEPTTPTATVKSYSVTSEGGTEYYESASEDLSERREFFKTFAQSLWNIFSPDNQ